MKLTSIELHHIKAFKYLRLDLNQTSVLVGQNDHGKSSILKAIDIVLNQLQEENLSLGELHPDLAERLLPIFPVNAKARRITLNYQDGSKTKQLHINVRSDLTFTVLEKIERNAKTTAAALDVLAKLRQHNRFLLIPALRDASSNEFQNLFSRTLKQHGLAKIIPQRAGGTPKEYRTLRHIRDDVSKTIKPYIDNALLPQIDAHFGFKTQHKLALKFDVDVQDIGEWILDNLRLGFQVTDDEDTTIALSEAGSGVQSGVLLALHRLEQTAANNPDVQYILAVEEPEAFLHPQKQKELYDNIQAAESNNLRVIVTTHSPYIVTKAPFTRIGFVRKHEQYSSLHVPQISTPKDQEIFDAYSNEVNNLLFFADKVVLVEGESDVRVIELLIQKRFGAEANRISVLSAAGNRNFSPYLRMIRAWDSARIPHLVVTDFDSLTKGTDRAVFRGALAAGYVPGGEQKFYPKVDAALDKDEAAYGAVAAEAASVFSSSGLNVFVFSSDLEYALVTSANKTATANVLTGVSSSGTDYTSGYDLSALRRLIGSKGIPFNPASEPPFKKPYVHKKIANTIDLKHCHPDVTRLLNAIEAL